jgi:uncharacterized protein YegJ (DUF2314 family)
MRIKYFVLLLFALSAILSCNRQPKSTDDPIVNAAADDPELEEAQKVAQSKLEYFSNSFTSSSTDTIFDFLIKADFIENSQHEHMWVSIIAIENNNFRGTLENDPQIINNIQFGDIVTIQKDQVEDWMIVNKNTMTWEGGYSIEVFQNRN